MGHQFQGFVEGGIKYALEVRFWNETRCKNYQANLST